MKQSAPTFREISETAGLLLVALGVGLLGANVAASVFATWVWAATVSATLVGFGALLYRADVRLYQGESSITEHHVQAE